MTPAERRRLDSLEASARVRAAAECWVRKEAYLKACGDGLTVPLTSVDVSDAQPARLDGLGSDRGSGTWRLYDLAVGHDRVGALVAGEAEASTAGEQRRGQPSPGRRDQSSVSSRRPCSKRSERSTPSPI
jgi:4'-phosphopantetheinyl transferase